MAEEVKSEGSFSVIDRLGKRKATKPTEKPQSIRSVSTEDVIDEAELDKLQQKYL